MNASQRRIADLIVSVQQEFLHANRPLSPDDIQGRLGIDDVTGAALLEVLVNARVLARTGEGYIRARRQASTPPTV